MAVPVWLAAALTARAVGVEVDAKVFSVGGRDVEGHEQHSEALAEWRGSSGLDIDAVSSHSWRRTLATVIDDAGLSARVAADQLGHTKVSMTQDVYMARKRSIVRWRMRWGPSSRARIRHEYMGLAPYSHTLV